MDDLRAIVLTDGDPVAPPIPLPTDATVIAADGGLRLSPILGLRVDVVVGDMDSVSAAELAAAEQAGARIERHPTDKDATDLELALDTAVTGGAIEITVVGGTGGRLDHLLANAQLLAGDRYAGVKLRWLTGAEIVVVCDHMRPALIEGTPGELVSLVPVGGTAGGVVTTGLRWGLEGEDLVFGSTRGISNKLSDDRATVSLREGRLLVVQESAAS